MKANGGYQFVGSDLWVRYIWEGTSAKGCVEIEHWGFFVHFVLGFEENSIYTLTYVLAKILQNGAKFIQKLTPGFKNHMGNLNKFRKSVESPKSWNLMGFCVQKIHSFS